MYFLKLFLIISILLASIRGFSQSDCQDDIDKAKKLFDDGMFRETAKLTKKILESCNLDKTKENEMLKLISSSYFELDELELAQDYITEFIKKNPYYVSSKKTDPPQFSNALSKIKSFPRFSVGFKAGIPVGFVTATKVFPILDQANYMDGYTVRPTFQGGLEFSLNIASFVALNLGAGLRIQEIRHQVAQHDQLFFHYKEQNMSATFPASIGFNVPIVKKISAQVYMGGEVEYFVQSKYTYDYTSIDNVSKELAVYLNQKQSRVAINANTRAQYRYAAMGGLKLSYKIEKFSIFADARYIQEMVKFNNPKKRFTDPDLFLNNNYVLSDIMLENLDISLGLMYNFSYRVKSKY